MPRPALARWPVRRARPAVGRPRRMTAWPPKLPSRRGKTSGGERGEGQRRGRDSRIRYSAHHDDPASGRPAWRTCWHLSPAPGRYPPVSSSRCRTGRRTRRRPCAPGKTMTTHEWQLSQITANETVSATDHDTLYVISAHPAYLPHRTGQPNGHVNSACHRHPCASLSPERGSPAVPCSRQPPGPHRRRAEPPPPTSALLPAPTSRSGIAPHTRGATKA